ncbi:MAG: DNA replication/repair protein RecF [Clostridia bacterium]|nr:DNA replication/repair protein RecF [Clostridia bacterium]
MYISSVTLKGFRNYTQAYLEPCKGVSVLMGDNAQGKTNILEAVFLCCTGRSHRTSHDRELIKIGQDVAYVGVQAEHGDGRHDVEIALNQTGRRRIKINGSPVSRSGELLGHVTGVLFAPEDLRMVTDGPAVRRRFMDMELSQIHPKYYYALQRYNRALKQRNALLKDCSQSGKSPDSIDLWDAELALSGSEIMQERQSFLVKLCDSAAQIHASITDNKEILIVRYAPDIATGATMEETQHELLKALVESREVDIRRATTSKGPHHDDMGIFIDELDARLYGSQGQIRTCALSLKLSEIELLERETGESPILMLDDVMSELDPTRRRQLIRRLEGVQTLVTCTDYNDLAGAEIGKIYSVKNAVLTEET